MILVALDLDGTLEDSRADMVACARRVRAAFGLAERPDSELVPWVSKGMATLYARVFDDHLAAGGSVEGVREAYEADYMAHVAVQTRLYDGVAGVLSELAEVATLAVVTAKPERISRHLLTTLGIAHHFGAVVGGDTTPESKPHPLLLQAAADRCGWDDAAPGARAFMVGDSAGDVRLGHAFGATTIWCAWGYATSPGDAAPDLTARRPAELPRLVRDALAP